MYQRINNLDIKREDTCLLNNGKGELVGNPSIPIIRCCQQSNATAATKASDKGSEQSPPLVTSSLFKECKLTFYIPYIPSSL